MFGTANSRAVAERLERAGFEAVFVGGAVRDHLLGKEPKDIDIATAAMPEQVKALFPATVDLGTDHGTVLVIEQGEPVEVTTFRTEGTYSDNRRPDDVQFVTSLDEDLKRRDFTINALAMTLDGGIIDPFGGRSDLASGIIRAVGEPAVRFGEDALRMVRAVRFVSVLGFSVESATQEAIRRLSGTVRNLSVERIKAEFDKLFTGASAGQALGLIEDTGLSESMPLYPAGTVPFPACAPFRNALDGWASLMAAGGFEPSAVANAYKLSNKERAYLRAVQALLKTRRRGGYTAADYYGRSLDELLTAEKLAAVLLGDKPAAEQTIRDALGSLPIRSKQDLAVRGGDIIGWERSRRPGQWVGAVLDAVEQAVLHGELLNDANAIKGWYEHEYKHEE
ncbi:CCA tRNA nucleotidyltransferase [Sporosarcina trichiuri]|uniref:CCA tRNA nucleotidyltransferase n=1 Tax=Sporosarcina trichiuri TaxID=3056445 RepID=UPI0025B2D1EE|nr:CCA tRNA nucleotidyltransferase [Sporosarcina sp. 0.2-SM1T-5]WJY28576.1 CCA tRNA nucleotidyltransferase [Sporosarcina sp. 0.2-SM1T-5]